MEQRDLGPEPFGECELCGARAELRPYGPQGELVCVRCGLEDVEAAARGFARRHGLSEEEAEVFLEVVRTLMRERGL